VGEPPQTPGLTISRDEYVAARTASRPYREGRPLLLRLGPGRETVVGGAHRLRAQVASRGPSAGRWPPIRVRRVAGTGLRESPANRSAAIWFRFSAEVPARRKTRLLRDLERRSGAGRSPAVSMRRVGVCHSARTGPIGRCSRNALRRRVRYLIGDPRRSAWNAAPLSRLGPLRRGTTAGERRFAWSRPLAAPARESIW